jgi:hypothetical protein
MRKYRTALLPLCALLCILLFGTAAVINPYFQKKDDPFEEAESEFAPCFRSQSEMRFYAGERFTYNVLFWGMKAGEAVLETFEAAPFEGRSCYRIRIVVQPTGFYARLYPAYLAYETWLDARTLHPVRTVHLQNYKRYGEIVTWDYDDHNCAVYRHKFKSYHNSDKVSEYRERYLYDPGSGDELTTYYTLRFHECPVGSEFYIDFFCDRGDCPFVIQVLKKRKLKNKTGRYDCYVIEPHYLNEKDTEFSRTSRMQVFVEDGPRRYIPRIRVSLFVGSLALDLVDLQAGRLVYGTGREDR